MNPRFSIVTVCRNSAAQLPRALESLRAQTWQDREWVVIDGASSDGTLELVRGSGERLGNWVSEPDRGIYDAMNKGWQRARGDIVYYLNSDDALHDAHVLDQVAHAFDADPQLDLVVGEVIYIMGDQTHIRRSYRHLDADSLMFGDLCHQAVFARRRLFERIGGFNLDFRINADYDWLIRVFRSGARVHWLDAPVAWFTTGGSHVRDTRRLADERRLVRLQYVSPMRLRVGINTARVAARLRRLVGIAPIGHHPLGRVSSP